MSNKKIKFRMEDGKMKTQVDSEFMQQLKEKAVESSKEQKSDSNNEIKIQDSIKQLDPVTDGSQIQ